MERLFNSHSYICHLASSGNIESNGHSNTEIVGHSLDFSGSHSPRDDSEHSGTSSTARHSSKPKIAIVGISGRFPSANSVSELWEVLYNGLDVHKVVPSLRWDVDTHVDASGTRKNTSATPFGCWLDNPGMFDARFFGMSPREAIQVDPAQRLALLTAYEAIEQAGIVPDSTPSTRRDRVGVVYGVTSNDWMETNSAQDIDTYFIPGGNRAFIPGRINYCFKFSGPSFSVDTACSSSLAAIHLACNLLWQGEVDTVIAGGTNVLTNPDFTTGLDRGHSLSRTGNCRTFDDSADGYCRGEGVATIILKRLEDAIADNDPIQRVILVGIRRWQAIRDVLGAELIASASGRYLHVSPIELVAPIPTILNVRTNHSAESESITKPNIEA